MSRHHFKFKFTITGFNDCLINITYHYIDAKLLNAASQSDNSKFNFDFDDNDSLEDSGDRRDRENYI